jgi:hypothetical protein
VEKIDIVLWVMSGGFGLMLVMWHGLNSRMDKIEEELKELNTRLTSLESKVAVLESKMADVSINVTHLMWINQTQVQKEVKEK